MPNNNNTVRSFFLHAFFLSLIVLLIWVWTNNPVLMAYNLQLTAFLVVVYFSGRLFNKKNKGLILDTIIFTAILLLVLSTSGGLGSPLFFLIYFLLFAVSLLFDPPTTLALTLALTLFFANSLSSVHAAIQLLSLLFISPLAIYFGKQYLKLLEAKNKIKILAKENKKHSTINNQLSANIENEETSALLWLTLDFKNNMLKIIHQTSELLGDMGFLTYNQKEKLTSVHDSAKDLLNSGEKLKEKIDRETD